ncbi:MAG: PSD1 domain-containing protein [Planctomycetes bacterium]|nr:PSD1 domain-containing protein [Planctomycetota bacterium]
MKQEPLFLLAALVSIAWVGHASQIASADDDKIDYSRDVRPILAQSCFACHGNDADKREAELRFDVREDAIRDRDGSRAIMPGDSSKSELIARVTSDDPEQRMPPAEAEKPLTPQEIEVLRSWIEQGAIYNKHWAFEKPTQAPLPRVSKKHWTRNQIDYFVLAELDRQGLQPSPEADRYMLIRRVYLDLIGLPPSPAEVDAFISDTSNKAYDKVVDQLLRSPRFGERWAQIWLDLARYADSMGYEKDLPRTIWRYRDWVIDAFNRDLPFDQFSIEQLAGDLLPDATLDQKLATAFHRNTLTNQEGGTDDEEFRVAAVKDRVDTTMQVWMGLTMGCAKCHSHKFDPLTDEDYYRFYAIFNQTADADRGNDSPTLFTPTREQRRRLKEFDEQISRLENLAAQDEAVRKQIDELKKKRAAIKPPKTPVMQELPANKRRVTHIQVRGSFLDKGKVVEPAVPKSFGALPDAAPKNRLAVARWLVHPDNPLTARVQVNRIWARLFGKGIVLTEEDFGTQGMLPTHPELLDWMAVQFRTPRESGGLGWSIKGLLRLIVTSATYRQSSAITAQMLEVDPQNLWLARGPRFRLEAEIVRDQALAIAGLLSEKIHGPSVMPPQPPGIWKVTYSVLKWKTSAGDNRYRRALYTYWRRTSPYPSMLTFDAGSRETCILRRVRTNTPLQALITLNDSVYVEAAGGLAQQIVTQAGPTLKDRTAYGFRRAAVRKPDEFETQRLAKIFESARTHFRQSPDEAGKLIKAALATKPNDITVEEFAAWIVVGNLLLNLDEVMMKP